MVLCQNIFWKHKARTEELSLYSWEILLWLEILWKGLAFIKQRKWIRFGIWCESCRYHNNSFRGDKVHQKLLNKTYSNNSCAQLLAYIKRCQNNMKAGGFSAKVWIVRFSLIGVPFEVSQILSTFLSFKSIIQRLLNLVCQTLHIVTCFKEYVNLHYFAIFNLNLQLKPKGWIWSNFLNYLWFGAHICK